MSRSMAPRVPVSQLLSGVGDDEEPKKQSKEDYRKAKELEEDRKAGRAPAAVDEEGRDINPHIPHYISNVPWYFNTSVPTLKHQRPQDEKEQGVMNEWHSRGVDTSKTVTKFRKGACENCGAMTHKKKDCFERPRKVGAKYAGNLIAHDEFVQPKPSSDYESKRDRWSRYDPSDHREIVDEFNKVEEAKQKLKAEKLKEQGNGEEGSNEDEDEEEDGDKYADGADMPGTKVDSKQRITVRNLRIREDTAKYLRNLDPNSAYYDPKTRSMRDNPNPQTAPTESAFAGENFVRYSGDTTKHSEAQLFAWDAHGKGVDVHVLADPTRLEMLKKEYEEKKVTVESQVKNKLLDKYGGDEHLQVPPRSLLLAQTEDYVEYSRTGRVIKGQEKHANRSHYEEDVMINNHTSVWGSYWHNFMWGFKCCHSFIKNSFCVGEKGKLISSALIPSTSQAEPVLDEEEISKVEESDDGTEQWSEKPKESDSSDSDESVEERKQSKKKKKKNKKKKKKAKDKKKEKTALEMALEAEERNQAEADRMLNTDERKRKFNSMYEVKKPSEEEVEAYLMKRRREEDPMAAFMDK